MTLWSLRLHTLVGIVVVFVCLVVNTGVALYFIAAASGEALRNPPLLIAVLSMGLAVAVGWGSLMLVVGLTRAGGKRAADTRSQR